MKDLRYICPTLTKEKTIMISKSLLKQIKALELKKFRNESGLFIAEGSKTVLDLLELGIKAEKLIATEEWLREHSVKSDCEVIVASDDEMKKASLLRTSQGVMAIFHQQHNVIDSTVPERELCLALDNVQDPGNLGTIIRIADWFGIENIYCSIGCVDAYNPKTVQATMGAIGRVKIHYINLPEFIKSLDKKVPVYGTFLDGNDIYSGELSGNGLIIMGNEGNGISEECGRLVSERLLIPNYPAGRATSESLNVSVATAIICSEFRRRAR